MPTKKKDQLKQAVEDAVRQPSELERKIKEVIDKGIARREAIQAELRERDRVTAEQFDKHNVPSEEVEGYHKHLETLLEDTSMAQFATNLVWLAKNQNNIAAASLAVTLLEWVMHTTGLLMSVDKRYGTRIMDGKEIPGVREMHAAARHILAEVEAKNELEGSQEIH